MSSRRRSGRSRFEIYMYVYAFVRSLVSSFGLDWSLFFFVMVIRYLIIIIDYLLLFYSCRIYEYMSMFIPSLSSILFRIQLKDESYCIYI